LLRYLILLVLVYDYDLRIYSDLSLAQFPIGRRLCNKVSHTNPVNRPHRFCRRRSTFGNGGLMNIFYRFAVAWVGRRDF
jgi:hypothetical protein